MKNAESVPDTGIGDLEPRGGLSSPGEDLKESTDTAPGDAKHEALCASGCSAEVDLIIDDGGVCSEKLDPDMIACRRALPFGLRNLD